MKKLGTFRSSSLLLWAIPIGILALVATGFFVWPSPFPATSSLGEESSFGVGERTFLFLSPRYETRALHHLTKDGNVVPISFDEGIPGRVVDYARSAGVEAVLAEVESNITEVYVREGESMWRVFPESKGVNAYLDLSDDGMYLAWASRNHEEGMTVDTRPGEFFSLDAWSIRLGVVSEESTTTLGEGFTPQFFKHEGETFLFMFDDTHISAVNVQSSEVERVALSAFVSGALVPRISPDGRILAVFNESESHYQLFSVDSLSPLTLGEKIGTLPFGGYPIAFASDIRIYGVETTSVTDTGRFFIVDVDDLTNVVQPYSAFPLRPGYKIIP